MSEFEDGTLGSLGWWGEVGVEAWGVGKRRRKRGGPSLLARPTARAVPMKMGTTDLQRVTGMELFWVLVRLQCGNYKFYK